MYVAVKGGEKAIENSIALLGEKRRGNPETPEISCDQIRQQLSLAVDRVMAEGALYDPELAALAVKQAMGDLTEAVFLLRAFRTTLPRFGNSAPLDTEALVPQRRVSAIFKDLPGGQLLGPSFDYTHRLLDFSLMEEGQSSALCAGPSDAVDAFPPKFPHVTRILKQDGLLEKDTPPTPGKPVGDITRQPLTTDAARDMRLQNLARGDEGFLLSLAYSVQRGFGADEHPFAAEIRMGRIEVCFTPEELGFEIVIGEIIATECVMVRRFYGNGDTPPCFTTGYGLVFGHNERKAMSMALVDRALRAGSLGEAAEFPAQNPEFVLFHSDNVEASGFVQHLKLPHYVDFQSELMVMRELSRCVENAAMTPEPMESN